MTLYLCASLNHAANEDILDMMDKFDSNHDGKLAYHEFVKMLQVDGIAVDI